MTLFYSLFLNANGFGCNAHALNLQNGYVYLRTSEHQNCYQTGITLCLSVCLFWSVSVCHSLSLSLLSLSSLSLSLSLSHTTHTHTHTHTAHTLFLSLPPTNTPPQTKKLLALAVLVLWHWDNMCMRKTNVHVKHSFYLVTEHQYNSDFR